MKMNYAIYTDKLEGAYKKAFDKIELYGFVHNINDTNLDDKMMRSTYFILLLCSDTIRKR